MQLQLTTELQLTKLGCARLVIVGDRAVLYHCFNNKVSVHHLSLVLSLWLTSSPISFIKIEDHASGAQERAWANDPEKDSRLEFQIEDAGLIEAITRAAKPTQVQQFPVEKGEEDVREEILGAALKAGILEIVT